MTVAPSPNDKIKNRVVEMFKEFVEQVDPGGSFIDHLIEKQLIDAEMWAKIIEMYPTPKGRCRELICELLGLSHPTAFITVREALREEYPVIVDKIDGRVGGELDKLDRCLC